MLIHSSNSHYDCGYAGPNSGAGASSESLLDGAQTKDLGHLLHFPMCFQGKELDWKLSSQDLNQHLCGMSALQAALARITSTKLNWLKETAF